MVSVDRLEVSRRMVFIGSASVGKTALVRRSAGKLLEEAATKQEAHSIKLECEGLTLSLHISDTPAASRDRTLASTFYRGANYILIVFDLTNRKSFDHLSQWIEESASRVNQNSTVIIVGNKRDLVEERVVSFEEAKAFSSLFNFPFFETSAKDNTGIQQIIDSISQALQTEKHEPLLHSIRSTRHAKVAGKPKTIVAVSPSPSRECSLL